MEIWEVAGHHPGTIGTVLGGSLLFGVAYNAFVAHLNQRDISQGYTALLVVGGVLATLAFTAVLIGLSAALWVLAVFGCTGAPMVIGDIYRHVQRRQADESRLRATLREIGGQDDNAV